MDAGPVPAETTSRNTPMNNMKCDNKKTCMCDECWIARRVSTVKFRRRDDDRFVRALDQHSASAYRTKRCVCDICKAMNNEYRREMRRSRTP
jgi:hypothetical protein